MIHLTEEQARLLREPNLAHVATLEAMQQRRDFQVIWPNALDW